jgi:hypothetical protein
VGDVLFDDARSLRLLMCEFLNTMRRQRAEVVVAVCLAGGPLRAALNRYGFWRRPSDWKVMIYAGPKRSEKLDLLLNADRWYLTRADIDTDE